MKKQRSKITICIISLVTLTGCGSTNNTNNKNVLVSSNTADPKYNWVMIDGNSDSNYIEEKCFNNNLIYRQVTMGNGETESITTSPNDKLCN